MKNKKKIILIVVAVVVALLIPDVVKMAVKAHKEKAEKAAAEQVSVEETASAQDTQESDSASIEKSEDVQVSATETNSNETATESATESETEQEPEGPEHLEYFSMGVRDGMYPMSNGSNDFIFFVDNKYIAPFTHFVHLGEEPFTFSDKNVERIESYQYQSCVITADGKNYLFNEWNDDPLELNEKSVYPACVYTDVTYMIPTSADGTVGDLYYLHPIYKEEQLVASDIVADTAGVNFWTPSYDDMRFLYTREKDGARTLIIAKCEEETIEKGAFKVYEKEVAQGNLIPIFVEHDEFYYYDQDKKELYYVKDDKDDFETKMVYSGDMDEYYVFESSQLYIVSGNEVYCYIPGDDEANMVLSTGLESIRYHGTVSPYGYHGGHRIYSYIGNCLVTDKDGKEYFGAQSKESLVEPNRKMGEDKAYYYPGGEYSVIAYIKDGVLYLDQYMGHEDGELKMETAILFDKEKVVDFCSDYSGCYTFVFTEDRNVYCLNAEDKKVSLIDSGMDYNEDGSGGNFAYDFDSEQLYYSKDGEFYRYGVELESIQDSLMDSAYLTRDWNYVYINAEGREEKHLLYGGSKYDPK